MPLVVDATGNRSSADVAVCLFARRTEPRRAKNVDMVDLRDMGMVPDDDKTKSRLYPCALCGVLLLHRRAFPFAVASLAFRASIIDNEAWLPAVHSRLVCPDPPPETAMFWRDAARREAWKAEQRFHARDFAKHVRIVE